MTTKPKNTPKYEIVKLGRRYVIRKWVERDSMYSFSPSEWKYYDKNKGSPNWWPEGYTGHATRYWTQNGALKALEHIIEGPKVVFAIGGDDDLV